MKVSELEGALLDYWVAKAEGYLAYVAPAGCILGMEDNSTCFYQPSTDWKQGGPIIERERIRFADEADGSVLSYIGVGKAMWGNTVLIAAMRCYVASKYGEEVPNESI